MPVSKIKNLILLILSVCVIFLLALVVPQRLEQARAEREIHDRLEELFASYDIQLAAESLPVSESLYAVELGAQESAAEQAALALLGQEAAAADDSTRFAPSYASDAGTCSMTLDGAFHAGLRGRAAASDILRDAEKVLSQLGFSHGALSQPVRQSAGVFRVDAAQQLLGVPVFSEGLHLTYVNNVLTEIDGVFYTGGGQITRISEAACISCADALVSLLSSRDQLGWVGSSVLSVRQGYRYAESASASMRLIPVWMIETDTGTFQVGGLTGEVSQQEG